MARITLEHPGLDRTIVRDERSLPVWEAQGWRRADATADEKPAETAEGPAKPRRRTSTET